jgi:hypothetical protein
MAGLSSSANGGRQLKSRWLPSIATIDDYSGQLDGQEHNAGATCPGTCRLVGVARAPVKAKPVSMFVLSKKSLSQCKSIFPAIRLRTRLARSGQIASDNIAKTDYLFRVITEYFYFFIL